MEDDFLEALVASERIGEFCDVIQASAWDAPRHHKTRNALRHLKESVVGNKIYAEEAVLQDVASLIQKLADHIDEHCAQLSSEILSFLEQYQQKVEQGEVREYHMDGKCIKLYEQALTHGVGAKVWEAAEHLCKLMTEAQVDISGKRVLELGSGCGLNGFFAAMLGAKAVYVTDFEDSLLQNLSRSADLNKALQLETYVAAQDGMDCSDSASAVYVAKLDWMDYAREASASASQESGSYPTLSTSERFPVIIGSDLMYEMKPTLALLKVIDMHLQSDGFCLFSMKVRYEKMLKAFIALGKNDFNFRMALKYLGNEGGENRQGSERLFDGGQIIIFLDRHGNHNQYEWSKDFTWQ